jgi:hypothetical protein
MILRPAAGEERSTMPFPRARLLSARSCPFGLRPPAARRPPTPSTGAARPTPPAAARRLVFLLPLACTPHVDPSAEQPDGAPQPRYADPAPSRERPPAIATCPIDQPRPQELTLDAVSDIGDVAGKRWLVAREADVPVLLHLDPTGALARTRLAEWTEDIAVEADTRLRLFHTQKPARWSLVDLRDPDVPVVGPLAPLPGLVPGEYAKAVASDGTRALVSLYRENPRPGGERYIGDTVLLDVATGEQIGPRADMTVWTAQCAAGTCYGVATVNADPNTRALVALGDTGPRRLEALGQWGCGSLATWLDGQTKMIAWSEQGKLGFAAVDLATGAHALADLAVPGSCPELRHLALADRHGVLVNDAGRARFIAVGPTLATSAPELLPRFDHRQQQFIAAGDGVLLADFDAASGLRHDPPGPDGSYEYNEVWQFSGRHRFLHPAPGTWTAEPAAPLPHDGEDGQFARGYRVHLLARPGHAGVLLVGDGLRGAWLPLRRPCP